MQTTTSAQTTSPKWWFGAAAGANANFFDGTTQRLNNGLIVPSAFHKGKGIRPFGSVLVEYRPTPIWGGSLNIGYDGRGGKFDDVIAPCDCPATLATNVSYITIEPTLRVNPWGGNLYFFTGPRFAFNLQKDFDYTQLKQPNTSGELSEVRKSVISAQVGAGYDIDMSAPTSTSKFVVSPFVSFHPYFGQDVREIESWSMSTVRVGVALKFGKAKLIAKQETTSTPIPLAEVSFSVRAPKAVVMKRKVNETLPLLNYVFFDEGSTAIPSRYVMLSPSQAATFKQEDLQQEPAESMNIRSQRQLNVYYNVLNILGDRMRANPAVDITLSGASLAGAKEGNLFATEIKKYLVNVFNINENRIATNGRIKPINPSEQKGGKKELNLLREGDRRVDILSNSNALMMELGSGIMKPVYINTTQSNGTDGDVIFYVGKANEVLSSYMIDVTSPNGVTKQYGPFTKNEEHIAGNTILGNGTPGSYKVVMTGTTKMGNTIKKESTVDIVATQEQTENGTRYSILYNFNKANTIATYAKFLTEEVAPLISENSTVNIHGHTDIIGSETYNLELSKRRAQETQQILEAALAKAGKRNVKFETTGLGEAEDRSPFGNGKPEERFYNRTVVIDIKTAN
ncbi:OmpA family protein [Pedobacter frigiditerrae]|uniref:OmpA family protein n=1 Tax=Pedobacter frigiditerrae TaxID=2530452 RepID=UPI001CEC379F|nr:OmpA family protein [Pedobacter frigiditerrae]